MLCAGMSSQRILESYIATCDFKSPYSRLVPQESLYFPLYNDIVEIDSMHDITSLKGFNAHSPHHEHFEMATTSAPMIKSKP